MEQFFEFYVLCLIIFGIIVLVLAAFWEFFTKEGKKVFKAKEDYYWKGKPRDKEIIKDSLREEVQEWKKRSTFFKTILIFFLMYIGGGLLALVVFVTFKFLQKFLN